MENTANIIVDTMGNTGLYSVAMKKVPKPERLALRPTDADFALLNRLKEKLGLDTSQVIRLGLRRLAEAEGMRAS